MKDRGNKRLAASTATRSSRLFKASAACWARMDPPDGWADFICKSDVFFDHVRQALNSPPPQIKLSCKPWNFVYFWVHCQRRGGRYLVLHFLNLIWSLISCSKVVPMVLMCIYVSFPSIQFWSIPIEPHSCTCVNMNTVTHMHMVLL